MSQNYCRPLWNKGEVPMTQEGLLACREQQLKHVQCDCCHVGVRCFWISLAGSLSIKHLLNRLYNARNNICYLFFLLFFFYLGIHCFTHCYIY